MGVGNEVLLERLKSGEHIEAFRIARSDLKVTWPKMMGGAALEAAELHGKSWLVAIEYPSGGPVAQTINLISGRRKAKQWKLALA